MPAGTFGIFNVPLVPDDVVPTLLLFSSTDAPPGVVVRAMVPVVVVFVLPDVIGKFGLIAYPLLGPMHVVRRQIVNPLPAWVVLYISKYCGW